MRVSDDEIRRIYTRPGHPAAFTNAKLIRDYLKSKNKSVTLSRVQNILSSIDGYVSHHEKRRPRHFNPFFIYSLNQQSQVDLFDMSNISRENDGVRFLLAYINSFSRKAHVQPVANKKSQTVANAMQIILDQLDGSFTREVYADAGTEFTGRPFVSLLRQHNIKLVRALASHHASICERFGKTLKNSIAKFLSQNETLRYIDVLQDLVDSYNNRSHSSLQGMSPEEASVQENESLVRRIHNQRYTKVRKKRRKPKFAVDDIVKVKTIARRPSSQARSFAEQVTGEFFRVEQVHTRMPIPSYTLRSMDTNEVISGKFNEQEIVLTSGNVYKIEKVLKQRRRNGKVQLLVKWQHFGPRHNSWIDADDVVDSF